MEAMGQPGYTGAAPRPDIYRYTSDLVCTIQISSDSQNFQNIRIARRGAGYHLCRGSCSEPHRPHCGAPND